MSDCCNRGDGSQAKKYDLIVVGGGSAGFSAAITAAEQGAQVAVIGAGTIGGTCVNVGCVPSKALIRAVESIHHANAAPMRFNGVEAGARMADWGKVIAEKDSLVSGLRQAKYADLLPLYNNIAYHEGTARLVENGVEAGGRRFTADRIVIATGTRPAVPAIPGLPDVDALDSTTALDLTELPKSMIVLGGGYIGVELAQMFSRAGVDVTLVFRSRLLPDMEPEIGAALTDYLSSEGITVLGDLAYQSAHKTAEGGTALTVLRNGVAETIVAERLLVATGRAPNVEDLGLIEAGVKQTLSGAIIVDDHMRTSVRGVYAAGCCATIKVRTARQSR